MKKRQNKHSLGVSALQIILALSLMSISAVLLASGFRSTPSRGGSGSVVVNLAPAGAQQARTVQPAVVSPFSDEELAAQAGAEAEMRAAERTKQTGFSQPSTPFGFSQGTAGGAPDLQAEIPSIPFEWEPMPEARPQNPRVLCTSMASGNWSNPAIWSCGFVPTAADDAVIASGTTVTIDTAAVALNLTVNGVLQYDPATPRSLTLGVPTTRSPRPATCTRACSRFFPPTIRRTGFNELPAHQLGGSTFRICGGACENPGEAKASETIIRSERPQRISSTFSQVNRFSQLLTSALTSFVREADV